MTHATQTGDTGLRVIGEEIIPEFGIKPPGTSATSGFRVAVIRVIGGVAEEGGGGRPVPSDEREADVIADQARRLAAWLSPVAVDDFRREFFGRRSLYCPPTEERLASVSDLRSWRVADLLAHRSTSVVAWFTDTEGRHLVTDVDPLVAGRLHEGGITLYLTDVDGLEPVSADVAAGLRVPVPNVKTTLFCNRSGASTPKHFDPVDTITIQVTGSKRWWIAPNLELANPTVSGAHHERAIQPELWQYSHEVLPADMPEDAEEYLLTPGAVLDVPRGWWHRTESSEDAISLHVHQVQVPWVDAILTTLRARLVREDTWRAGAMGLWDVDRYDEMAAETRTLLDDLSKMITTIEPADVLPGPGRRGGPSSAVVRRAGAGISFRHGGVDGPEHAVINVNEYGVERRTTVEVSPPVAAVCRDLTGRAEPTPIEELADRLGAGNARDLVDELITAGFLRPV